MIKVPNFSYKSQISPLLRDVMPVPNSKSMIGNTANGDFWLWLWPKKTWVLWGNQFLSTFQNSCWKDI